MAFTKTGAPESDVRIAEPIDAVDNDEAREIVDDEESVEDAADEER